MLWSMDEDGWDLEAVVRGCRLSRSAATADTFSSFPSSLVKEEPAQKEEGLGLTTCFPELRGGRTGLQELDELCKAFFSEPKQQQPLLLPQRMKSSPSSSSVLVTVDGDPAMLEIHQPQQPRQPQRPVSQMSRSKRRKNQQKKVVCHVPADGLSSDMWAWRKYGQKPIKGSPYPRGYYRCSSSKVCLARKQVERSRTDPGMFIITYTAEHNHPVPTHRNSLAGSTRTKFPSPTSAAGASTLSGDGGGEHPPPVSSPLPSPTAAGLSPTTPLMASMEDELFPLRRGLSKAEDGGTAEEEEGEDEEGALMVDDMELLGEEDLVFMSLDYQGGGSFDDHLLPSPWLGNDNINTAAEAGGS